MEEKKTSDEIMGDATEEEIEHDHVYEFGVCAVCGDVWEPDDFSGATEGDR